MRLSGQRMLLNLPDGVVAHEIDDSGGIMYFTDGTRTSWRRVTERLTCPDWCPWHRVNWSGQHDAS